MPNQRFPKNARVIFIGDSITHNNLYLVHIVDYYHRHFKDDNINFYNTGIAGANAGTQLDIFDCDIATRKPTHAVIMLGTNDSGRDLLEGEHTPEMYGQLYGNFVRYQKNLDALCKRCRAIGAEITLCAPPPLNEYGEGSPDFAPIHGSYALIQGYANFIKEYASEHGYGFCDYFNYMTRASLSKQLYDEDRVHPIPAGHVEMAKCFLSSQGLTPDDFSEDVPEYLKLWHTCINQYRDMRAVDFMVIGDYEKPTDEALAFVHNFVETGEPNGYFVYLANEYFQNKPREEEIIQTMLNEMEIHIKAPKY